MARKLTIEWAVREISEALGAYYEDPKDRLKALLDIWRVLAPTYEHPVVWAFNDEAMRLGHEHNLCHRCGAELVKFDKFEDEWYCPTCDALLLAMRQEKALQRVREAV